MLDFLYIKPNMKTIGINLIYWNGQNFGDAASPFIIEEITGIRPQLKEIDFSRKRRVEAVVNSLLMADFSSTKTILFPWQKSLTAVGSIMSWAKPGSSIWGSGFMNYTDKFYGGRTFAVRGELTDLKLRKDGFTGCNIYGDPALLLPLWIQKEKTSKRRLGIVPHWKEVEYFQQTYGKQNFIIDPRSLDLMSVVAKIISCEYILASSLHGLIIAQAFNIPALWIRRDQADTDGFKFHDYFSSVGISMYAGFRDIDKYLANEKSWRSLFDRHDQDATIKKDLSAIQMGLLRSAPFKLREEYQKLIL